MLNVGAAMSATTAGRMPANAAATHGTSWKCWKNMAIASMMSNEGIAVPIVVSTAPLRPFRR